MHFSALLDHPFQILLLWLLFLSGFFHFLLIHCNCSARTEVPETLNEHSRYLLDLLIGAAFSLWRAVFLTETFRDVFKIHESQEAFLEKLITDNAVGFADDKANRHWTVEYYLESAKLCLARGIEYADSERTQLREKLKLLLSRRTHGDELPRYEWECAHYALRVLFKVIDPASDLKGTPPDIPEPRGLGKFFEN